MAFAPQIIQGTWEEIATHADEFQGRRLTLIVSDEPPAATPAPILEEKAASLLVYLQERLKNASTDPEVIRQADAELEELHRNLNENRIEAGESPLFSE